MKKLIKLIVITTLVVTVGFAFTSCVEYGKDGYVEDLSQLTGTWKGGYNYSELGKGTMKKEITIEFGPVVNGRIEMKVKELNWEIKSTGGGSSGNAFQDAVSGGGGGSYDLISEFKKTYTLTYDDVQMWTLHTLRKDKELGVNYDGHYWTVKKV